MSLRNHQNTLNPTSQSSATLKNNTPSVNSYTCSCQKVTNLTKSTQNDQLSLFSLKSPKPPKVTTMVNLNNKHLKTSIDSPSTQLTPGSPNVHSSNLSFLETLVPNRESYRITPYSNLRPPKPTRDHALLEYSLKTDFNFSSPSR